MEILSDHTYISFCGFYNCLHSGGLFIRDFFFKFYYFYGKYYTESQVCLSVCISAHSTVFLFSIVNCCTTKIDIIGLKLIAETRNLCIQYKMIIEVEVSLFIQVYFRFYPHLLNNAIKS